MSTPILEQIAAEVARRVARVSLVNGFNIDLSGVQRPTRASGIIFDDKKVAILQGDPESNADYSHEGNPPATAWTQPFDLYLIVRPSDTDPTASDTLANLMAADVQRAITCNDSFAADTNWYYFTPPAGSPLAVNASFGGTNEFARADGSYAGVVLRLSVIYRVDETNPYNVRA